MHTLRWILGLILVLLGGGFFTLLVFSNGLRKSFGASENNPLVATLALVAAALLLSAIVWPENRLLLHAGAVAAVGLIGLCVWQLVSESATVLWFGIFYLLAWLAFYWGAAWRSGTAVVSIH